MTPVIIISICVLAVLVTVLLVGSLIQSQQERRQRLGRIRLSTHDVIPAKVKIEILQLLSQNLKINAMKRVREETGMDLATAKAYVDSLGNNADIPAADIPVPTEKLRMEVLQLLSQNLNINAIKRVREETGMGLAAAKRYVDSLSTRADS